MQLYGEGNNNGVSVYRAPLCLETFKEGEGGRKREGGREREEERGRKREGGRERERELTSSVTVSKKAHITKFK